MRLILLLAMAWPACAQFRSIELTFEGVGCATCIESMPARMQRIRGVESAIVDAATGILRLKLTDQNRVRIEQVRDAVEQDGTKVRQATVTVMGELKSEAGKWMLHPAGVSANYEVIEVHTETGKVLIEGKIVELHQPPPLTIRAASIKMAE